MYIDCCNLATQKKQHISCRSLLFSGSVAPNLETKADERMETYGNI